MNKKIRIEYKYRKYLELCGFVVILFYQISAASGQLEDKLLLEAAIENDKEKFSELLKTGSDPNWIQPIRFSNWTMCEVTKIGKEDLLQLAIDAGGDIDIKNKSASTSASGTIFCALSNRNIKAIEILINNNVNLEFNACSGCTITYGPVVGASGLKEYQAVWLMLKSHTPSEDTISALIFNIERHPIAINGDAYEWRSNVVQYLRESGYSVTPWEESQ